MTKETIFKNARLITKDSVIDGCLIVKDDLIYDISQSNSRLKSAIDVGGDFLIPGLIELHTDNLERHIEPRPKVDWPHMNALLAHDRELAGAGITTVYNAMRVGSIPSGQGRYFDYARQLSKTMLHLRKRNALKISHFLHLRAEVCSETLVEELAEFSKEDRVGLLSVMDHTPGQRQFRDMEKFKAYATGKGRISPAAFEAHVENLYRIRSTFGDQNERIALAEARRLDAVLASHDDTSQDHVARSSQWGVSIAEFPTTLQAAQACRQKGIAIMMGAPNLIRGGSHSGNIAAKDLAELDLLDITSSDYIPAALLFSAFLLGNIWGDIAKGVACITTNPANAAGLSDRGELRPAALADFCRVKMMDDMPILLETYAKGHRVS